MESFELFASDFSASSNTSGLSTCQDDLSVDGSFDKTELSFHNKIELLLKTNGSLQEQLERANNQIERLINNSESFELEREIFSLRLRNSDLIQELNRFKLSNNEIESENETLKARVNDLAIKTCSISELKEKIKQLHTENAKLKNDLHNAENLKQKFAERFKSRNDNKNEIFKLKNKIDELNVEKSIFMIQLTEAQNKCTRIQAELLKEKETDVSMTSEAGVDLRPELSRLQSQTNEMQKQVEQLRSENSGLVAKCLMQQKHLEEQEHTIDRLQETRRELSGTLEKESVEVSKLRDELVVLKVEIKMAIEEKLSIENTVGVIRQQLDNFKCKYAEMKSDLHTANKRILELENLNQELFMSNSWTVCELERAKEKDVRIENLKLKLVPLEDEIRSVNVSLQEKTKEIERYDSALSQYRILTAQLEKKLEETTSDKETIELDLKDNIKIVSDELKMKDLQLREANSKIYSLEKDIFHFKAVIMNKDEHVMKLERMEADYKNYLGRSTDDSKVELLNKENLWKQKSLDSETFLNEKHSDSLISFKVKERNMQDKLKKLETINRTLIRKVKEHLTEKKSVEERLKDLQRSYDFLSNQMDCLQLSIASKDVQIDILQKLLHNYQCDNEQLQIAKFERDECQYYRKKCQLLVDKCGKLQNSLKEAQDKIVCSSDEIKELEDQKNTLESELKKLKDTVGKLEENLVKSNKKIQQTLSNQTNDLSSNIHEKVVRIERLESDDRLKTSFKNELKSLKSDKYFLQRLCSDLRVALSTYMDQNRKLQERLKDLTSIKVGLPISAVVGRDERCEQYIRRLVVELKTPANEGVVSDLRDCLSILRDDICGIQRQILEM